MVACRLVPRACETARLNVGVRQFLLLPTSASRPFCSLGDADDKQLLAQPRPRLMPLRPPAPGWVLPRSAARPPVLPGTTAAAGGGDDPDGGGAR